MSYFRKSAFDVTPGTAFEAFRAGTASPMLPQAMYRPQAAGPKFLAGLGEHQYWAPLRQRRLPLQGLGDPLQDVLAAIDPSLRAGAGLVLNAMWPALQAKMDEQLRPLKIFMGITAVAAAAGAAFSFLVWNRQSGAL